MFIPPSGGAPVSLFNAGTLWLSEVEDDMSGVSGNTVPCTNIEGSQTSPTQIPAANGLQGYSREFVTGADAIEGVFTAFGDSAAGTAMIGTWTLQTSYQPESVRFTDREWDEITRACNVILIQGPVVVP